MATPRDTNSYTTATSRDGRIERLSVPEAAEALGISASAVRKRVERGTLEADKDEDGRLFVYLDTEELRREPIRNTSHDASRGESHDKNRDELLTELREQNRFLREELVTRNEELRRKDHIIAALTERIPELEPPRDARESPVSSSDNGDGTPTASPTPGAGETPLLVA